MNTSNSSYDFSTFIYKENFLNYSSIIFTSGNYCTNLCLDKRDLEEFKECYKQCDSFHKVKWGYIDNYLEQINDIIIGRVNSNTVNQNHHKIENRPKVANNENSSYLADKYAFKDYMYQSEIYVEPVDQKKTTGSLFGRNK